MQLGGVEAVRFIAIVVGGLVMFGGLWLVFDQLRRKQQGFGPSVTFHKFIYIMRLAAFQCKSS